VGTNERRERHKASLKREILDAASRLFVEEGYHRVTMRRIAEQIEYSPTTIYLHFKDKNELLQAVCEETFSELAGTLARLEKTARTPLGYLREGLRTYIDFGLAHPAQYTIAFVGPTPGPGGGLLTHPTGSRAFDILRQAVLACAERGDIQAANTDMTAQALWAAVHGLTSLLLTMPGFPALAKSALIDHTIDTLIAGLKTTTPPPRVQTPPPQKKWNFMD
jgi:AcrR family transcriptional regulator